MLYALEPDRGHARPRPDQGHGRALAADPGGRGCRRAGVRPRGRHTLVAPALSLSIISTWSPPFACGLAQNAGSSPSSCSARPRHGRRVGERRGAGLVTRPESTAARRWAYAELLGDRLRPWRRSWWRSSCRDSAGARCSSSASSPRCSRCGSAAVSKNRQMWVKGREPGSREPCGTGQGRQKKVPTAHRAAPHSL